MSLEFTAFGIEQGGSNCLHDHLTIMDGDGTTLMGRSCNLNHNHIVIGGQKIRSPLPANIVSRSNIVNIFFSTDHTETRSGWSLRWTAVRLGNSSFLKIPEKNTGKIIRTLFCRSTLPQIFFAGQSIGVDPSRQQQGSISLQSGQQ